MVLSLSVLLGRRAVYTARSTRVPLRWQIVPVRQNTRATVQGPAGMSVRALATVGIGGQPPPADDGGGTMKVVSVIFGCLGAYMVRANRTRVPPLPLLHHMAAFGGKVHCSSRSHSTTP